MKKYYIILISIILIQSCSEDFLDVQPETFISSSNYYQDQDQINSGLIGCYGYLQDLTRTTFYCGDLPTDIAAKEFNSQDRGYPETFEQFDELRIYTNNGNATDKWNTIYSAVANINTVLKKLPDAKFTNEQKRKQYEAELKFLRGLNYFTAVRLYGGVPLVLEPIESSSAALNLKRSPLADVYKQIEIDLKFAAENLPESYTDKEIGRATKYAASGVLGKVYLQQLNNAGALAEFNKIKNSGKYQLLSSYKSIFDPATPTEHKESVFTIHFATLSDAGQGANWMYMAFMPKGAEASLAYGKGGGSANAVEIPTTEFIAELQVQPNDLRIPVLVNPSWTDANNTVHNLPWCPKFFYPVVGGNPSVDWPYLRYADVLLCLAELENAAAYPSSNAFTYLNLIRQRAGLSNYTQTELPNKDAFQSAVEKERKIELAFEGHRWYDLIRWNKVAQRMSAHFTYELAHPSSPRDLIKYPLSGDAFQYDSHDLLLPIPPGEINKVPGVLEQNPGY